MTTSPWASAEVPSHFRDSRSEQDEQDLPIPSKELTSSCASASAAQLSTPATLACSVNRQEEKRILNSLWNYIGLGCLYIDHFFEGYDSSLALDLEWSFEVCYPDLTAEQKSAFGNHVVELLRAGWIMPLTFAFVLTAVAVLCKPGCAVRAADTSSV